MAIKALGLGIMTLAISLDVRISLLWAMRSMKLRVMTIVYSVRDMGFKTEDSPGVGWVDMLLLNLASTTVVNRQMREGTPQNSSLCPAGDILPRGGV